MGASVIDILAAVFGMGAVVSVLVHAMYKIVRQKKQKRF